MADKDLDLFGDNTMVIMIGVVVAIAVMAQVMSNTLAPISQQMLAQSYGGRNDPRTIKVTNILSWLDVRREWPYTSWIGAYIINDGPSAVQVSINSPEEGFTMNFNETVTINRAGAQERISVIFFRAFPGLTASVRVTGEF